MNGKVSVRRQVFFALVLLVLVLPGLTLTASAGQPVGTTFPIRNQAEDEVSPAVAYNSQRGEYLVVLWNDRPGCDDIRAERLSRDGKLLGGKWIAAGCPAEHRYPDVAYNSRSNQYLIVWVEESGGYSYIRSQRFSADLQPQAEGVKTLIVGPIGQLTSANPAVAYAYTADKYLVVWEFESNLPPSPVTTSIIGHVVLAAGTPDPSGGSTISPDPGGEPRQQPDLAYNVARNEYIVVWQQPVGADTDIYARRVTGHGELLFPEWFSITPYVNDQLAPSVAALPNVGTGGQYLVAWEEDSFDQIYARRFNGDGTPDGARFFVLPGPATFHPAVASSESARRYLVVAGWRGNGVQGQEVSSGGNLVYDKGEVGGIIGFHPAVAAGSAGTFLVAWEDRDSGKADMDIFGRFWGNRVYLPLVVRNYK
jgi:hypothetical protein